MSDNATQTMSLEAFRASRKFCADLSRVTNDDSDNGMAGYVYIGDSLYIRAACDKWPDQSAASRYPFILSIANQEWTSDNLAELEPHLYEFALSAGYISAPSAESIYTALEASPVGRKLIAAGYAITNTGGGCMAWTKEDGGVWIVIGQGDGDIGEDGNESEWGCCINERESGEHIPSGDLSADLESVIRHCRNFADHRNRFTLSADIIDSALNAALVVIQKHIGQTDGGVASIYFSDREPRDAFRDVLQAYADFESIYAEPEISGMSEG